MNNRIAILIPAYNAASYLPDLFRTINDQFIPFDEIICYDDYSTDNTAAVAESFGAQVIKGTENMGASFARNRLIEACSCEWIHFHDADDLLDHSFVSECKKTLSEFEKNTSDVCLLSDMLVRNKESRDESIVRYNQEQINLDSTHYFLKNNGYSIIGCYSKDLLKKINGFKETLRGNEDPDLHIRLAIYGANFVCIKKALVTNLVRTNSFSSLNWLECMKDRFRCLENYSKILDKTYYSEIGRQVAELSNYFYREKEKGLSKKARELAKNLKINRLESSRFSTVCSRYFGLSFYLWIYRRRVDLKLI